MVRKKIIRILFDYLTVFLGILASFITASVAFVSDSLIVVLSTKVKSNINLSFVVPTIILTIYLLALFALSIVFRKNNYMPISVLLHLMLSPILASMMHIFFIAEIIDLFAIRELITPAEGMMLIFVAIIFCIELLVLSIISVLTFIITKVVKYKKSKMA